MPCFPPLERWVTRAQVWLGTLVEVALPPAEASEARFAAAFAAIAQVHSRMNAHDAASDLARIARTAHRRTVVVAPETVEVLELAQTLVRASHGMFDCTALPARAHCGARITRPARRGARCDGMQSLHLEPGHRVRTAAPLALDLSGIAKGYAVDRGVGALRAAGAGAGLVNAGGDLRVFGAGVWMPVRVRLPQGTTLALPLLELQDAAVASSADYFRADDRAALFDPRTRRRRAFGASITVVAPTCALADALTKIVALMPARAAPLLARFDAHAFRLSANESTCRTTCHASTTHLRMPAAWTA